MKFALFCMALVCAAEFSQSCDPANDKKNLQDLNDRMKVIPNELADFKDENNQNDVEILEDYIEKLLTATDAELEAITTEERCIDDELVGVMKHWFRTIYRGPLHRMRLDPTKDNKKIIAAFYEAGDLFENVKDRS